MRARFYDVLYRIGAPWEIGPRKELVDLVRAGRLQPSDPGPRAADLGCGSGANSIFLARSGFDVTGIDFSGVALRKARAAGGTLPNPPRFICADLTQPGAVRGPFDLLVDYGTLDDVKGAARAAMAATFTSLARSGSLLLLWCFYGERSALPLVALTGPSRATAGLAHGEEEALFGDAFEIETIARPPLREHGSACFLMTRR